jgi:hypothetical protein
MSPPAERINQEYLLALIKGLDDKFTLLLSEAEKRNGQRFDAQQEAVSTALNAAEKAVKAAMDAAEKAVLKAEIAAERRFESVNEFRKALSDQTELFLPRTEYAAAHASLSEKVDRMDKALDRATGSRQGAGMLWGVIATIVTIVIAAGGLAVVLISRSH